MFLQTFSTKLNISSVQCLNRESLIKYQESTQDGFFTSSRIFPPALCPALLSISCRRFPMHNLLPHATSTERRHSAFLLPTVNTAATKPRNHAFLFPQCDKHPAPSYLLSTDPRYRYCAVIASLGLAFPWVSAVWSVSLLRPKDLPWYLPPFFLLFPSVPTNESRPSSEVAQKNP